MMLDVDLELLKEQVHGVGLGQERSSIAVLFQAGQGHPVEWRVRGAWHRVDTLG